MLGVALCGGGMKCAAQLGALQVMEELGLRVAMLAGSSMGAVMATIYASGLDLTEAGDQICRIRMSDVFVGGLPVPGLNHGRRLHRLFTGLFGDQRIEDLRIPVLITSCDLMTGRTIWLDKGRLADALYASCAIPGLFAPLAYGQALLGDGCLSEPLPASELRNRGALKVIGLHLPQIPALNKRGPLPLAFRSLDILLNGLSGAACKTLDLSIQPAVGGRSAVWWNQPLVRQYIEAGRVAALQLLPALIRLRAELEEEAQRAPGGLLGRLENAGGNLPHPSFPCPR